MSSIDISPGRFIAFAAAVVYGVILVEIWMWTAASVVAVAATLLLIAGTAALICRSVLHLLDDGAGVAVTVSPAVAAARVQGPEPAPAAPAVPHRAPVRARVHPVG